jgi:hypothetical protein
VHGNLEILRCVDSMVMFPSVHGLSIINRTFASQVGGTKSNVATSAAHLGDDAGCLGGL